MDETVSCGFKPGDMVLYQPHFDGLRFPGVIVPGINVNGRYSVRYAHADPFRDKDHCTGKFDNYFSCTIIDPRVSTLSKVEATSNLVRDSFGELIDLLSETSSSNPLVASLEKAVRERKARHLLYLQQELKSGVRPASDIFFDDIKLSEQQTGLYVLMPNYQDGERDLEDM